MIGGPSRKHRRDRRQCQEVPATSVWLCSPSCEMVLIKHSWFGLALGAEHTTVLNTYKQLVTDCHTIPETVLEKCQGPTSHHRFPTHRR